MPRRILATVMASLAAILIAPSPAQAGDTTSAKRSISPALAAEPNYPDCLFQVFPCWGVTAVNYIADNPVDGMQTICLNGRLHLGAGHYDWGHVWDGQGEKLWQNLLLGESDYTMATCFDPKDGGYIQTSWLDPDHAGWGTISVSEVIILSHGDAGTHTWGVYLDPLF
jgi:hypothetical protein